jgi:hypothetical protein
MFKFPYIDQIAPRVSRSVRSSLSSRSYSEYQDEFSKIGGLIVKHKLHDHSECGKEGILCKHKLLALNYKLKRNLADCPKLK